MPADKKPLESVFIISPSYIDGMFALIADGSKVGATRLAEIATRALRHYKGTGIYSLTRTRKVEIESAIEKIKVQAHSYERLQEFKQLISSGKWESTSYNVYLFVEFIKELGGYDFLYQNNLIPLCVALLKPAVFYEIERFTKEYEIQQQRKEELKALRPIRFNPLMSAGEAKGADLSFKKIHLVIDPQQSNEELIKNDTRSAFVLRHSAEKSLLCWINSWGAITPVDLEQYTQLAHWLKNNPSPLSEEQVSELKHHLLKVKIKSALNPDMIEQMTQKLAARLGQIVESKETKPQSVAINVHYAGGVSEAELVAQGMRKTFIVRHAASPSLAWIDAFGTVKNISLAKYPQLSQWLVKHSSAPTGAESEQLQILLARVKTIDENKQELLGKSLSGLFGQRAAQHEKAETTRGTRPSNNPLFQSLQNELAKNFAQSSSPKEDLSDQAQQFAKLMQEAKSY